MRKQLFGKYSWHDVHRTRVQHAVTDVERLDRSAFSDPALAAKLERIAEAHGFAVATLKDPQGAKGRDEQLVVSDYGDRRTVKRTVLDVTIPFSGDGQSFEIAPSNRTLMSADYEIRGSSIVLTINDDGTAQDAVDDFVKTTSHNLDQLRSDVAKSDPEIQRAVQAASQQCQVQIKAEQERDSKLKFKVER